MCDPYGQRGAHVRRLTEITAASQPETPAACPIGSGRRDLGGCINNPQAVLLTSFERNRHGCPRPGAPAEGSPQSVRVVRLHRGRLPRRARAAVRHRDEGRHHQRCRLPTGRVRAGHHLPTALGGRCVGRGDRRRGRRRRGDGSAVRSGASGRPCCPGHRRHHRTPSGRRARTPTTDSRRCPAARVPRPGAVPAVARGEPARRSLAAVPPVPPAARGRAVVRAAVGRAGAEDQASRTSRPGYGC